MVGKHRGVNITPAALLLACALHECGCKRNDPPSQQPSQKTTHARHDKGWQARIQISREDARLRFGDSGRRGWKGWRLRWTIVNVQTRGRGGHGCMRLRLRAHAATMQRGSRQAQAQAQAQATTGRACRGNKQPALAGLAWYLESRPGFAIACAQRFRALWGHVR